MTHYTINEPSSLLDRPFEVRVFPDNEIIVMFTDAFGVFSGRSMASSFTVEGGYESENCDYDYVIGQTVPASPEQVEFIKIALKENKRFNGYEYK